MLISDLDKLADARSDDATARALEVRNRREEYLAFVARSAHAAVCDFAGDESLGAGASGAKHRGR
jgi:hypothetical protein